MHKLIEQMHNEWSIPFSSVDYNNDTNNRQNTEEEKI